MYKYTCIYINLTINFLNNKNLSSAAKTAPLANGRKVESRPAAPVFILASFVRHGFRWGGCFLGAGDFPGGGEGGRGVVAN
jgi:hypothetical protein